MHSWRVWVLARAELGRAGFHLTFSEFSLTFVFSLTFCGHCNTFAILESRCNRKAQGCIPLNE